MRFLHAIHHVHTPGMFVMQATQVRKSNHVPGKGVDYDPDTHRTCTVYAGTVVQQVARMTGAGTAQINLFALAVMGQLSSLLSTVANTLDAKLQACSTKPPLCMYWHVGTTKAAASNSISGWIPSGMHT